MTYEFTLFKSIYDNKTHRRMTFRSWDEFRRLLFKLSEKPGYKPKKGEYAPDASPLISPSVFDDGDTRANKNVVSWAGWAALDVDDFACSWEEAMAPFQQVECVIYSSASSSREKPKFRVVFPLTEHVPPKKIRHFWYALNTEFGSIGDKQVKDFSRMYYVPALYPGSFHFIFAHQGDFIDPNELMKKHPWVDPMDRLRRGVAGKLPQAIQDKLAQYKKSSLDNKDISWTGLHDCPFVNRKQVAEYGLISNTGWYAKMFGIMVSIAIRAMKRGYPITEAQIADLCREIDAQNGGWYKDRPFEVEALRAIDYAVTQL